MYKSIVNTTKKYPRIIIQIINDPLTDLREIFVFEIFNQVIYFYITKTCKNTTINRATGRIPLTLIENTTPIWEVFVDEFYQDLVIIFNTFRIQDGSDSIEE